MKMKSIAYLSLGLLLVLPSAAIAQSQAPAPSTQTPGKKKPKEVIAAAIEAMGGKNYLDIKNSHSSGEFFTFDREGRKGYAHYFDWTNLNPVKWRFQLGEGKNQTVEIYNLDWGKAGRLRARTRSPTSSPRKSRTFASRSNVTWTSCCGSESTKRE